MKFWIVWMVAAGVFSSSTVSWAQAPIQNENIRSWKRGTAIVMFSGLAGGVLGLSTLSFYGKPQEHTANVTTGALIGMLAGAGFLVWESSQNSRWGVQQGPRGTTALAFQYDF